MIQNENEVNSEPVKAVLKVNKDAAPGAKVEEEDFMAKPKKIQNTPALSIAVAEVGQEDFMTTPTPAPPSSGASEVLVVGGGGNEGQGNLQDAFKKFRKQKVKERKIMQLCKEEQTTGKGPRTQEFKDALRMKFIERAKQYIGVPYAERYKKPEDPVAPIYLDCCGLVRRVMLDLAEDFGFLIGRWNQAYQMDTLPIAKEGVHELKPGDLIFYEGMYVCM